MNLVKVKISNFRCYQQEVEVDIDSLTTLVGKNDVGKSTVLEALEIFFNNATVKIDSSDANVYSASDEVTITCEFDNLPEKIVLDSGAVTNLKEEFLLNEFGRLEIKKVYDCSKKTPTVEAFILALHPVNAPYNNLLDLKEKELQSLVKQLGLDTSLKGNPGMRKAIWSSADSLEMDKVAMAVSKPKEDSKQLWEQIDSYLPFFALFQSDRNSSDADNEVQDPMKAAITAALSEVQEDINRIQTKVREKAEEIAQNTYDALQKLDPRLAKTLAPQFTPPTPAKWNGLFTVKMDTEDGIPLNKRGSGVRRMILVSFFKAEAERRLRSNNKRSIIYAIEEPETAQHPNNQRILIESFKSLAAELGCQVLLTTHSPGLASELPVDSIRYIENNNGSLQVKAGVDVFADVAAALGLTPDSRVKLLICVEGPTDVQALKSLSRALYLEDNSIPDLSTDPRVAFVLLGGSTLKHWVDQHYLKGIGCKEFHLYDADVAGYAVSVKEVNARGDGSYATLTNKHEIECYLHREAILEGCGVDVEVNDHPQDGWTVPKRFAEAYSAEKQLDGKLRESTAKTYLANNAFPRMTSAMLKERDSGKEVEGWFRRMAEMMI